MAATRLLLPLFGLLIVSAQFPPEPEGIKVIKSRFHEGVTISYKQTNICETTPGVKSYSGYVHLPEHSLNEPGEAQNYPMNTFFWFFESRKDPYNAPLSIWLNGGPGGSSMMGALAENGPCFVNRDSNSTRLNPWSWNNEVNMLYIDQPTQVGFSYDVLTNVTVDVIGAGGDEYKIKKADFSESVPKQNNTFRVGTLASQKISDTANGTNHSAIALWHFAQTFFEEFPAYKPADEKISLWTESYGGKYGPTIFNFWQRQNERIANGSISGPGTHYLHLDTLGLVNACMDSLCQDGSYIEMAYNNTYGIQAINETQYEEEMEEFGRVGGYAEKVKACYEAAAKLDPNDIGAVKEVNKICNKAARQGEEFIGRYMASGRYGWFDITHPASDPFPPNYLIGYLNQEWVQRELGVPVNFTVVSSAVYNAFDGTEDMYRGGELAEIAYLLSSGVKVHMMFGDRDYACNWIGGENASIAIPWKDQQAFKSAGYTPFVTNPFYSGGLTRQHGNLSFTRVYQAGHLIPAYQPETAYNVFMRALFNKDIPTGLVDLAQVNWKLSTEGPGTTWDHFSDILPPPPPECYVLQSSGCSDEQIEWLKDGTAIVKDYLVIGREEKSTGDGARSDPGQVLLKVSEEL